MSSQEMMNRILESQSCSIGIAEGLTKALHKENKLDKRKAIRFRPLFGDFDIVNADLWETGRFDATLCEDGIFTIEQLINRFL